LIGATTLDEFRENIEKDGALARRFQQVLIEPTFSRRYYQNINEDKDSYETYHKVFYPKRLSNNVLRWRIDILQTENFLIRRLILWMRLDLEVRLTLNTPKSISNIRR
jgi:ATP-dependent Clp protease ATP-binding subunit ClpC